MHRIFSKNVANTVPTFLFFCFWILKPFYILPSGYPQAGDAVLCLAAISWIVINKGVKIKEVDKAFCLFTLCVSAINTAYYFYYGDFKLLLSTSYFIFNTLAILLARDILYEKGSLTKLIIITRLLLIAQLVVYVLGLGRWYAGVRYMGTFNDPNQMGFFLIASFFIIKLSQQCIAYKENYLDDALIVGLLYLTASTGMFLAVSVYYFLRVFLRIFSKSPTHAVFMLLIIGIALTVLFVVISNLNIHSTDNLFWQRVQEKIGKLSNSSGKTSFLDSGFIKDRNLDKIFIYPEYIFWGGGEGALNRFILSSNFGELHCCPLAILFYYGLIPFSIISFWIKKNFNCKTILNCSVFAAIMIESMTLINYRQPYFWIIILMFTFVPMSRGGKHTIDKSTQQRNI